MLRLRQEGRQLKEGVLRGGRCCHGDAEAGKGARGGSGAGPGGSRWLPRPRRRPRRAGRLFSLSGPGCATLWAGVCRRAAAGRRQAEACARAEVGGCSVSAEVNPRAAGKRGEAAQRSSVAPGAEGGSLPVRLWGTHLTAAPYISQVRTGF